VTPERKERSKAGSSRALAEIERLREENEVLRECAAECGRDHLAEIERLTAESDKRKRLMLAASSNAGRLAAARAEERARADRLSRELDRHIDALASLGHLPDDAEHTRWCEPCRRVREGGADPPPCRECASMVVGGRCLSCGAEHTEET
jgi:hypothetical protein